MKGSESFQFLSKELNPILKVRTKKQQVVTKSFQNNPNAAEQN